MNDPIFNVLNRDASRRVFDRVYLTRAEPTALERRLAAEQAEARGNRSQGLCTSGEQLAYVEGLVLREAIARKAAELAPAFVKKAGGVADGWPFPKGPKPSAGVSAEEKASVLGDGWIAHDGGPCPVAKNLAIEVRYRSGRESEGSAGGWVACWRHDGDPQEIVAYRLKQPAVVVDPYAVFKEALAAGKVVQCLTSIEGGQEWRSGRQWNFNVPPSKYRIAPEGSQA